MGPKLSSRMELRDFLESRAAYLAQKSISEYTQARANMMFSTLLGEKAFQDAYEKARWFSFPATLSMVAEALAARLRNLDISGHGFNQCDAAVYGGGHRFSLSGSRRRERRFLANGAS